MSSTTFSCFLFGRFLSQLATRIGDFVFPLAIYKQSGSLSLSGLALAVEWLPRVVGLPLCGSLADRFRGGRLLAIADALRGALAVVPFLYWDIDVLLAVSAVFGFLSALSQVTLERVVAASGHPLPRTQMALEAINNLAFIFGSAIAASLVAYMNLNILFIVLAGLFVFPIPFAWRIGEPGHASRFSLRSDVAIAFSILARTPRLRRIVTCGFLLACVAGIVTSTGPAMVSGVFGLTNASFAHVQMYAAVATFIAILLNRYVRSAAPRVHWFGLAALGVGLLLLVTAPIYALWTLGYGVFFAGVVLFSIYLRCERVAYIPSEHYGKALGVIMVLTAAGLPVGGILVGCFANLLSTRGVIAMACPVFALALAASGLFGAPELKRSRS
ncbi:MFS transporter [Burkholderia sp. S-53]|uniref:MFS transporter n=1 Tax=Burkholderia sp. S-53 TaxID=2906514 RepID=UPI0021D0B6D0|nr:MFS transporter [Burkholderia sp. S-53]UXU85560.1 MFS transporter [Burkholderia sp. S-53]